MNFKLFSLVAAAILAVSIESQASIVSVDQSAFSGATVIDFEDVPNWTSLNTQYASKGISNFNATVLGAQGYANIWDLYPAFSGTKEVFVGASIEFASAVDRVGAWIYKFNGNQFLTALDQDMNVLLTVGEDYNSTDSDKFDFVGVKSSSANIKYVVISNKDLSVNPSWNVGGPTTMFDNLTFGGSSQVAEPSAIVMLTVGLLGLIGVRRKVA